MNKLQKEVNRVQELKDLADQAVADEAAKFAEDLETARANRTEIENTLYQARTDYEEARLNTTDTEKLTQYITAL
jgi:thioesterase domain-containing protein